MSSQWKRYFLGRRSLRRYSTNIHWISSPAIFADRRSFFFSPFIYGSLVRAQEINSYITFDCCMSVPFTIPKAGELIPRITIGIWRPVVLKSPDMKDHKTRIRYRLGHQRSGRRMILLGWHWMLTGWQLQIDSNWLLCVIVQNCPHVFIIPLVFPETRPSAIVVRYTQRRTWWNHELSNAVSAHGFVTLYQRTITFLRLEQDNFAQGS